MSYVALAEAALVALLLWMNTRERASHDNTILEIMRTHDMERQGLLNRIQRPEMTPVPGAAPTPNAEEAERQRAHAEALARVGTVKLSGDDDGDR